MKYMYIVKMLSTDSLLNKLQRMALLSMLFALGGCADFAALSNCPDSGQARYGGKPIASRSEHEQAQRFSPVNPGNCLLYVIRQKDWYTGGSVLETMVILTEAQAHKPLMTPSEVYADNRDRVATIDDGVYTMWEVPAGMYFVTAIFSKYLFPRDATFSRLQQLENMSEWYMKGSFRASGTILPARRRTVHCCGR